MKKHTPKATSQKLMDLALELGATEFKALPSDRDAEEAFVKFCAILPPDPALWRQYGDPEFLGGVAVMLAGHSGYDRATYLALAETLHPGSTSVEQYEKWYRRYRPDFPRLFSMIDRERRTHARAGSSPATD